MKKVWSICGAYGTNLSSACESQLSKAEENVGPFYIYNVRQRHTLTPPQGNTAQQSPLALALMVCYLCVAGV